jgi:hypothetical protein
VVAEMTKIQEIQSILGVTADGIWGSKSQAALDALLGKTVHVVKASSFADPDDVWAFRRCKAQGHSDGECFKVGDNGIGCWGDDTTVEIPYCALPREDWAHLGPRARGKLVRVWANNHQVICQLRDTMPSRENIHNGAGIDLNPAAVKALGLKVPLMVDASWQWV